MTADVIQFRPRRSCFTCEHAMTGELSGLFCDRFREYVDPDEARSCLEYTQGVSMGKKREEAKRRHPAAQRLEIDAADVEAYLASLHTSAWGRTFSTTKKDHRDAAVNYILDTITGVLRAAERRNDAS